MTERDAKTLSKEFEVWTRVPSVIRSEIGYCLCTFEAALEHVRCCGDGV